MQWRDGARCGELRPGVFTASCVPHVTAARDLAGSRGVFEKSVAIMSKYARVQGVGR
jgi:hypothetical protein